MSSKANIPSLEQRRAAQEAEKKRREEERAAQEAEKKRREKERAAQAKQTRATAGTTAKSQPQAGVVHRAVQTAAAAVRTAGPGSDAARSGPINWRQPVTLPGWESAAPGRLRVTPGVTARPGGQVTGLVQGLQRWDGSWDKWGTEQNPSKMARTALPAESNAIAEALKNRGYAGEIPGQEGEALGLLEAQTQADAYKAYVRRALQADPNLTVERLRRNPEFQRQVKEQFPDVSLLQATDNIALTPGQKVLRQIYRPGDEQAWETELRSVQAQQQAAMEASGETQRQWEQEDRARREKQLQQQDTQQELDARMGVGQSTLEALRSMDDEVQRAAQERPAPLPPVVRLPGEPGWQYQQRKEDYLQNGVQSVRQQQASANIAAGRDPEDFLTEQDRQSIDRAREERLSAQNTAYFLWVYEQTGSWTAAMAALEELVHPSRTPIQALLDESSGELQWKRLETYQQTTDAEIARTNAIAQGQGDLSAGLAMDIAGYGTEAYDADKAYFLSRFGANGYDFGENSAYLAEKGKDYDDYLYEGRTLEQNLQHYLGEGWQQGPMDGSEYDRLPEGVKRQVALARTFVSGQESDYGVNIPRYSQGSGEGRDWAGEVEEARFRAADQLGQERFVLDTQQMILHTLAYSNLPFAVFESAVRAGWLDDAIPEQLRDQLFLPTEAALALEDRKDYLLALTPGGEAYQDVTEATTKSQIFIRDVAITLASAGLGAAEAMLGKVLPLAFNAMQNFGRARTETLHSGGSEGEALANGAVNAVAGLILDYGLEKAGSAVDGPAGAARLDRTLVKGGSEAMEQVTGAPLSTADLFKAIAETWAGNQVMDAVPEIRWTDEKKQQ